MSKDHFEILPQHKEMIIKRAKSFYKIYISEGEVDELQREEPLVNFNYRQAELLRRTLVLRKIVYPTFKSREHKADDASRDRFNYSFMSNHLAEAQHCFICGSYLGTIFLCRSSLEIGLREAIAHARSYKNKTPFLKEYQKIEKETLRKLIPEAQKFGLIEEEDLDKIFMLHPKIKYDFKPRNLLDKFIHGGYSDLFVLVQEITIEGLKSRDFEEFIERWSESDKKVGFSESLARSTYARIVLSEELALFLLQAVFNVATLIFFERLNELFSK